jgi:hypothetical protein
MISSNVPSFRPARSWSRLGHRVIARLAEPHISPEAKAAIAELLEPGESLADARDERDQGRLPGRGGCGIGPDRTDSSPGPIR